jgi:diacylglycerol kinase
MTNKNGNKNMFASYKSAFQGVVIVFKSELNFRIQIIVGLLVLLLAIFLPLQRWEFVAIVLLVFLVLIMEMINTAIEKFNDLLKPRLHHYVYMIKDIMAGAVLFSSVLSIIVGLYIFFPHLKKILERGII